MADREKVINELVQHIESALSVDSDYVDCVRTDLLQTTVGLLKEQEPVKPVEEWNTYLCGNCNRNVYHEERQGCLVLYEERYTYCPNCGRKVKWDE